MKVIDAIMDYLRDEKDNWNGKNNGIISFKEITSELRFKSSVWLKFKDESGLIKIYEEGSIPYSEDLDLNGVARDVMLAGSASFFLPVLVPFILTWRATTIVSEVVIGNIGWKNTYLFIFDAFNECIFAIEFHYSSGNKDFILHVLEDIKYFAEELELK